MLKPNKITLLLLVLASVLKLIISCMLKSLLIVSLVLCSYKSVVTIFLKTKMAVSAPVLDVV